MLKLKVNLSHNHHHQRLKTTLVQLQRLFFKVLQQQFLQPQFQSHKLEVFVLSLKLMHHGKKIVHHLRHPVPLVTGRTVACWWWQWNPLRNNIFLQQIAARLFHHLQTLALVILISHAVSTPYSWFLRPRMKIHLSERFDQRWDLISEIHLCYLIIYSCILFIVIFMIHIRKQIINEETKIICKITQLLNSNSLVHLLGY